MWKWLRPSYLSGVFWRWRVRLLTRFYDWRYPNARDVPRVGQLIYVESQLYLSHGEDDFEGGLARVKSMEVMVEPARVWVEVEEQPRTMHSWEFLAPKQNHLRARYGKARAHADPDRRPEFNRWD